jgi:hypothetical protein
MRTRQNCARCDRSPAVAQGSLSHLPGERQPPGVGIASGRRRPVYLGRNA